MEWEGCPLDFGRPFQNSSSKCLAAINRICEQTSKGRHPPSHSRFDAQWQVDTVDVISAGHDWSIQPTSHRPITMGR